jgi:hypothetical protein
LYREIKKRVRTVCTVEEDEDGMMKKKKSQRVRTWKAIVVMKRRTT